MRTLQKTEGSCDGPDHGGLAPGPTEQDCTLFQLRAVDVFGPFSTKDRAATRSNKGTSKVWALLLTCLASRAVHVEMLLGLDTSSFRNALRRFLAIQGRCNHFRSDRGTNFVGSLNQKLDIASLKNELNNRSIEWDFNPPGASHFGGVWERKIGQVRRPLDAALLQAGPRPLSFNELQTLMQEAAAVVNSTPLWTISSDPNYPLPLSPFALLSLKETPYPNPVGEFSPRDNMAYGKLQGGGFNTWPTSFGSAIEPTTLETFRKETSGNNQERISELATWFCSETRTQTAAPGLWHGWWTSRWGEMVL
ncbi:uncharacterized protein LOC131881687 [Tigriopus californicus]|uniref:uncharacterized protein LOC131881687 n=1 Tax=Tigriopus californicus TaxID=6832 RepID=UPI0027DA2486|nr:uncharacterized protein LOC131881687 [Tigriopus californicus]